MPSETHISTRLQDEDGTSNGPVTASISTVPVTVERKPFVQPEDNQKLHAGEAMLD